MDGMDVGLVRSIQFDEFRFDKRWAMFRFETSAVTESLGDVTYWKSTVVVRKNSVWVVQTTEKRDFPIDSIFSLGGLSDGPISGFFTTALPAEFMPVCFDFELLFSHGSLPLPTFSAACSNF
ncbi:MAG: hypothetical protein WBM11_08030 [Terriglobales bacterium]